MKRVFIIHGWSGSPDEGWFPWLKGELQKQGFTVEVPLMPNPDEPVIDLWVRHLAQVVGRADEETFFVGHSIGCQTILRYIQGAGVKIGGAVFVAGWFQLTDLETEEEQRIGKPWIETRIDFPRVKSLLKQGVAIFSDDDPVVPLQVNKNIFEKDLGCKTIIEQGKGHFSGGDEVRELPSALEALLGLANP